MEGLAIQQSSFDVTPEELVFLHRCLSSKVCVKVFKTLQAESILNISAISRKAGCNNNDALRHLRNLSKLGIVQEEFYAGRHTFTLKKGCLTELMKQAITVIVRDG